MKHLLSSLVFTAFILSLRQVGKLGLETGDLIVLPRAVADEKLFYPELVNKFYQLNEGRLFWTTDSLRQQLVQGIDTAFYGGLVREKYHEGELSVERRVPETDSIGLLASDRLFTDAAIALSKDIYQGYRTKTWVGYDQLSPNNADTDNDFLLQGLMRIQNSDQFKLFLTSLEPSHTAYTMLKQELRKQTEKHARDTIAFLVTSMNFYRWIHHFHFEQVIVINLPAARLQYYENDSVVLQMKTVVGKPSTPSPRFATVCDQAILYPYWYVPRSITFNEYLPKIKNDPSWLDGNNMQVIDGSGKIMDHHKMNWAAYHTGYFPYIIRQSTGCDNALGVIKFNIITPYGVYLHDTNNKTAFLSGQRFYSHGCIRLEDPFELGNRLLAGKLDTNFLRSCFKEQKPVPVVLGEPVPVFSVYMPAMVDAGGKIRYYKDIYKLINW